LNVAQFKYSLHKFRETVLLYNNIHVGDNVQLLYKVPSKLNYSSGLLWKLYTIIERHSAETKFSMSIIALMIMANVLAIDVSPHFVVCHPTQQSNVRLSNSRILAIRFCKAHHTEKENRELGSELFGGKFSGSTYSDT